MYLHEYQAKEILSCYAIAVPEGRVADSAEDAEAIAREVPAKKFAVKAQVLAGGRGKAGGVALVATSRAVRETAKDMLGKVLVTDQTGPEGCVVRRVYVEAGVDIERSLFIAAMIDPRTGQVVLVGSKEGGEDIEEQAALDPAIMERWLSIRWQFRRRRTLPIWPIAWILATACAMPRQHFLRNCTAPSRRLTQA